MNKKEKQNGSVTLETSIVLPIFIFIILFIYGLFAVVRAQNQVLHTLIQSTRSLSLDSYLTESVESMAEEGTNFWGGLPDVFLDFIGRADNDEHFSVKTDWYKSASGNDQVVKDRFIGYLTGGDEAAAEKKLQDMGVVGGLSGITFETAIEDEILMITVKYKLQYWFDFFGMGELPMEHSITARLWM